MPAPPLNHWELGLDVVRDYVLPMAIWLYMMRFLLGIVRDFINQTRHEPSPSLQP